jgi:hypothetical protein
MSEQPANLHSVMALLDRVGQAPADALPLMEQAVQLIRSLPPERAEVLSRFAFELGTLFTLIASFENIEPDGREGPPEVIRMQHDSWVRGVVAGAIPCIAGTTLPDLAETAEDFQNACESFGSGGRFTFETNWRVDDKQGFVSRGAQGEILAPATLVTGDGFWFAPLDWRLQKDQTIEVRVRNLLPDLFPASAFEEPEFGLLRWVVVAFWVEELKTGSVQ